MTDRSILVVVRPTRRRTSEGLATLTSRKESDLMARRRSFVPECPYSVTLEGRLAPSSFSIGDWFSSQYKHIKEDLGITHKPKADAASGIKYLWNNSKTLSKPTHTAATTPHQATPAGVHQATPAVVHQATPAKLK